MGLLYKDTCILAYCYKKCKFIGVQLLYAWYGYQNLFIEHSRKTTESQICHLYEEESVITYT
jgi:hypothetical protein